MLFGGGRPQGRCILEKGRIADHGVEDRQGQGPESCGDIALDHRHAGHAVGLDIPAGQGDGGLVPFQTGELSLRAAPRRRQQGAAGAAADIQHPASRRGVAGRRQQGGVHTGAVALRRLMQHDAPVQQGVLGL